MHPVENEIFAGFNAGAPSKLSLDVHPTIWVYLQLRSPILLVQTIQIVDELDLKPYIGGGSVEAVNFWSVGNNSSVFASDNLMMQVERMLEKYPANFELQTEQLEHFQVHQIHK